MTEAVAHKSKRKSDETADALPSVVTARIRSMTGYGRASIEDDERVTAEVRSVNGRFFKLSVKVPGRYGALEDRIKTMLNAHGVKRGSIDANLFFEDASDEGGSELNQPVVAAYARQAAAIAKKLKIKGDV